MKMNELIRYDIPLDIIQLWRQGESDVLLPLQEMAIKRYGLLDLSQPRAAVPQSSGNLLIQAPTSSGKTFIGEMAAIQTALRRKKVIYLVPLKALAEEKYQDFREKYARYGIQVIISTRDHREFDSQLEGGDFSIAVVVYEKLAQLLVRRPERIEEIALIIADELEILSDPERGAMAEILLTRILRAHSRLIGLSAVIGGAERLAQWLNAKLLFYERRPVELRYGILRDGIFHYRTYNERCEGEEALLDVRSESPWEVLTENVKAFAARNESCLIFVKAKHESRRGAELLARRVDGAAASEAIAALRRIEPTRSRDTLLETLNTGVAFHNADLSPEERKIVEQAFRAGEIKVVVSTSTLALGMNLPARNVFIAADKWRYDDRLGMPWKTPILRAEYENMGGRAGRYGVGHAFGRSILVATTPFDYETLWRRYIEGECEPIEPRLAHDALEEHVLRLVASRFCLTQEELETFLEGTLTAQWVWRECLTVEEVACRIRAAKNRAVDAGVITCEPEKGRLEATPLGMAIAAKGITIPTAHELEKWIGESGNRLWSEIDLILAAAMTRDGRMLQVSLTANEYEHADYVGMLKRRTETEGIAADVPLNRIRNCNLMPFYEEVRAIKIALFLSEWIDHAPLCELEEKFHAMAGQILAAADQVAWLIDAAAAVATAMGVSPGLVERMKTLSERIQRGLLPEAIPLARLNLFGLTRTALLQMLSRGLHTPDALAAAPIETLTKWMPPAEARRVKEWARAQLDQATCPPRPQVKDPILIVDDRRPCEILLDGVRFHLQEKQYRLIRVLAGAPGECIPYETIYQSVWGDTIVEPNQMHFQKRRLIETIKHELPGRPEIITTVPKRGFMLALDAEEVMLNQIQASNAA
jgi:helicase